MSNIVERLRSPANVFYEYAADNGAFLREAADEITRLRAENEKLREENDAWQMDGASCANEVKYLRAENKRLREALKETLAIARRNEAGDYVVRARAALEGVTEPPR